MQSKTEIAADDGAGGMLGRRYWINDQLSKSQARNCEPKGRIELESQEAKVTHTSEHIHRRPKRFLGNYLFVFGITTHFMMGDYQNV